MNLDTQIEQTRIALQILEGRKQGTEPEWEWYRESGDWIRCFAHEDPIHLSRYGEIRIKPETKQHSIKLGDWIRDGNGVESMVLKTTKTRVYTLHESFDPKLLHPEATIQISRDQGATWTSIKEVAA